MMSDVGDIDDMVKNCIYLLEDAKRLAKFKSQAKRRAHDFSIDKILPLYEQLYQQVITHA
jgi:glycosyltransferase involved in cell wall biosynthesis